MKEELIELRELATAYSEVKKNLEEKKEIFNEAVKGTMVVLESSVKTADYNSACEFLVEYYQLKIFAEHLKKEHPRYGEKRVRETLIDMVRTTEEYQNRISYAEQIVDAYLTFEKADFNTVQDLDAQSKEIVINLVNKADTVKSEKVDTILNEINGVIETAKPYGEIAKKQMRTFGGYAKKALSIGAKQLIKILDESNQGKNE